MVPDWYEIRNYYMNPGSIVARIIVLVHVTYNDQERDPPYGVRPFIRQTGPGQVRCVAATGAKSTIACAVRGRDE